MSEWQSWLQENLITNTRRNRSSRELRSRLASMQPHYGKQQEGKVIGMGKDEGKREGESIIQ